VDLLRGCWNPVSINHYLVIAVEEKVGARWSADLEKQILKR
jgi:hypothetical protein